MKCPLCKHSNPKLFETIKNDRYLKLKVAYRRCANCGLVFIYPQNLSKLNELYRNDYRKKISFKQRLIWLLPFSFHHRKTMRIIKKFINKPGRALDVGCSEGKLLHLLKLNGWKCTGIEPTQHYAEFARSIFGLDVNTGFIEKLRLKEKYDLITFCNVLEHMPNPEKTLKSILRNLTKDGIIYIKLPTLRKNVMGAPHLFLFDKNTLNLLLSKVGLRMEHYQQDRLYQYAVAKK